MRRIFLALCIALAAILLTGCVSINWATYPIGGSGMTGRGNIESYSFNVGEIREIRVEMFCNIEHYTAPSDTVTLEIQPNLVEFITVEESGGVLTVRANRNISWSGNNTPVLTVGSPALSRVSLAGAGNFTAHETITGDSFSINMSGAGTGTVDLVVERLSVTLSGAGDIRLTGTADTADISMAGAGRVEALSMQTREADINLAGAGAVRLSCSESLRITAGGVGSVEYRGSPNIDVTRGGLVSVRQVD